MCDWGGGPNEMANYRRPIPGTPLELMDSGVSSAARLPADVRIAGRRQDFELPMWRDGNGDLRIGLPKVAPQHGGDMDQIIVSVAELFATIGSALDRPAEDW